MTITKEKKRNHASFFQRVVAIFGPVVDSVVEKEKKKNCVNLG